MTLPALDQPIDLSMSRRLLEVTLISMDLLVSMLANPTAYDPLVIEQVQDAVNRIHAILDEGQ